MSLPKSPLIPVTMLGLAIWLCGAGSPQAEEAATAIAPSAVRLGAVAPCRIVQPIFERKDSAREAATPTRYPGGAKLSQPVAAPCPARPQTFDL